MAIINIIINLKLNMETSRKIRVVYDIETFINCFTYTDRDLETNEVTQFVIWKHLNDLDKLKEHLSKLTGMIGYNNINFDYPVLHYIMNTFFDETDTDDITESIYAEAQRVINSEFSSVKEQFIKVPQLDLMRIWHYDSTAKMTSLKKLQVAMMYKNVQDMPKEHFEPVDTFQELQEILDYNLNDVDSTLEFFNKTRAKLELRKGIYQQYKINALNYSDTKMGEMLMLRLYCDATGEDINEVSKRRTSRKIFKFKECIPEYIKFETPEFNKVLEYLNKVVVTELKESFKYSFEYRDFVFDMGTGGIHGCIKSGIYEADDDYVIIDADVGSLYPSLGITLGLYPAHLSTNFPKIYSENIVQPRLAAKKRGDKVMADGFKLAANSVYGKSNSQYSWLYDPLYTIKTTLAGQLALIMLSEQLFESLSSMVMLQINTDGLTIKLHKSQVERYYEICANWELQTGLGLEYVDYSKMIIRDVNNYIGVYTDGKVKRKGTFCTREDLEGNGEWHKSFKHLVVPAALNNYFTKGIPVEETIKNETNIFNFCKTYTRTKGFVCYTTDELGIGKEFQAKTNRYFLSNKGHKLYKEKEGRISHVEKDYYITIYNKSDDRDISEFDINYQAYIDECYKIIHVIDGTIDRQKHEKQMAKIVATAAKEEEKYLKYCINKIPTEKQFAVYGKDWLIEKYGMPETIRPSK